MNVLAYHLTSVHEFSPLGISKTLEPGNRDALFSFTVGMWGSHSTTGTHAPPWDVQEAENKETLSRKSGKLLYLHGVMADT